LTSKVGTFSMAGISGSDILKKLKDPTLTRENLNALGQ